MNIPIPELVIASLISLVMISPKSVDIAGMLRTSDKAGEHFSGTWKSYSPTRFGAMSMEFAQNGKCQIRTGTDEASSCRWEETAIGRAKIEAMVAGRDQVFSASLTGDYLVVMEPGRESHYVRSNTKAAHQRQQMVKGPSTFTLPW